MAKTTASATTTSVAAIVTSTRQIKMIAPTVATQGGSTLDMVMVSIWNVAFEVAVMRLVSVPGIRSAK